jgi:NDP-sugar pyrophosphorylase family protein
MVLAAGEGTRLKPLTDRMPKALVPVAGRPMIEYALLLLRRYGIRDIIINLHHFGEQIEDRLGDGRAMGLSIRYSHEPELLDTGGGLLKAREFLSDRTFIVINTDVLIDLDLAALIQFHNSTGAAATLVLRPDPRADEFGSMDIDADGRIIRFLQSRATVEPNGALRKMMFTGVQVLEPRIFDHMLEQPPKGKFSTTRDTYPRMLIADERLFGFPFGGCWQDLGTGERIRQAEENMRNGRVNLQFLQPVR